MTNKLVKTDRAWHDPSADEETVIQFELWVPIKFKELIESQLHAIVQLVGLLRQLQLKKPERNEPARRFVDWGD